MRTIYFATIFLFVLVFAMSGCSTNRLQDPATPEDATGAISSNTPRQLWGIYQFTVDKSNETLETVPVRSSSVHLNALGFLEPPPLVLLTIDNLQFNGNMIEVDVGLRHPFLGMTQFSGFDVCGILISDGSTGGFNDAALVYPSAGDFRLLNSDGYTRWWNPLEFPVNTGDIFCYVDGLLGTPDSIAGYTATLNGYKYFCDSLNADDDLFNVDPMERGLFSPGVKNVRHYSIAMGDEGLSFNYAVDASWQFPDGDSPWEAPDDFPPQANRPEAWFIDAEIAENSLWNDGEESGGHLLMNITAYDWYGSTQSLLSIESPGNFTSLIDEPPIGLSDVSALWEYDSGNATPAEGSIEILLTVKCEAVGYGGLLPGKVQAAYTVLEIPVSDEPLAPTDFVGWHGFGYSAENTSFNPNPQGFDYTDFEEKWFTEDVGYTRTGVAVTEDYAYAASCTNANTNEQHHLNCYDINDGSIKWTKYLNPTYDGAAAYYSYTSPYYFIEYNVGYVVIGGDRVWCFNAVTGEVVWEYGEAGWNFCENSPKYYDGKVYITGESQASINITALHCINAQNGSGVWVSSEVSGTSYSVPACKDGNIYWGMSGGIYCFDADSGVMEWSVPHGTSAYDYIMILGDRLYLTQYDEQLICMNPTNGAVIWVWNEIFHTGSVMHKFAPALTYWIDPADSKTVICFRGEDKAGLHAVKDNGSSAELLWGWNISTTSVYGSPVYNNGVVYFGEGDSDLLRGFNTSGTQVCFAAIDNGPSEHGSYGQAGFAYGRLVASCVDGVYCFE